MSKNRRRAVLAGIASAALALPAAASAAGTYEDAVLAQSPQVYLRLSEAPGTTVAQDTSTHDRDGAYVGAPTRGVPGPFTDAGTAAALTAPDWITAPVPVASGTVELWVNPNRIARGQQAGIAAHGNPATDGWALGIGAKRKLAWVSGGTTVTSKVSLSANVWTMLTVSWTANKLFIYRNGALAKSESRGGAMPLSTGGALALGGTGAGAFTGAFAGRLDEIALYSQALTVGEINAHFVASHVPVNTKAPTIAGKPEVGKTLTVHPGSWGDGGTATYQWQRCDAEGDDCDEIDGATGTTYVVVAEDACATLEVAETMTNATGAGTAISDPTGQVPGSCAGDPVTGGDVGTGGGAGADPTTTPAPATTPVVSSPSAGPAGAAAGCLKLLAGRRKLKVRGLGTLRLKATPGSCLTAPLAASFKARKGVKLKSVRYKLDGKRLKRARLMPAALRAGTHTLSVRVTPRAGHAKRGKLRLRVALG
jgi:hypothetical protein